MMPGMMWDEGLFSIQTEAHVRPSERRWGFVDSGEFAQYVERWSKYHEGEFLDRPHYDPDTIQDEAERHRLGRVGESRGFGLVQSATLKGARHIVGLYELFSEDISEGRHDQAFSWLFYILEGGLRFSVRGEDHFLSAGDAYFVTHDSEIRFAPWSEDGNPKLPVKYLVVGLIPKPVRH